MMPPVKRFLERRVLGTGDSDSARYWYSEWLRQLVAAAESGLSTYPGTVAELGPGDSLGMGMAALLPGVGRYYAYDHVDLLLAVCRCMYQWLAPGGFCSHQAGLKCHGWAEESNGRWTYSDLMWNLIRGKDLWLIILSRRQRILR